MSIREFFKQGTALCLTTLIVGLSATASHSGQRGHASRSRAQAAGQRVGVTKGFLPKVSGTPQIKDVKQHKGIPSRIIVGFRGIDQGLGSEIGDPLLRGAVEYFINDRDQLVKFRIHITSDSGMILRGEGKIENGHPVELKGRAWSRNRRNRRNRERFSSTKAYISKLGHCVSKIVEATLKIKTPQGTLEKTLRLAKNKFKKAKRAREAEREARRLKNEWQRQRREIQRRQRQYKQQMQKEGPSGPYKATFGILFPK